MTAADEFARFADRFQEPLLLVSSTGRIASANRSAVRRLFNGGGDPVGRTLTHVIEEPAEQYLGYLRLCSRSSDPLPGVLTLQGTRDVRDRRFRCAGCAYELRDGGRMVMLRLTPKEDSASRFVALNDKIEQLTREVSRRVHAEEELHAQHEMLRVTLSSIGDAVITTDVDGRVTFMNPIAESHTGWAEDEAHGRPLEEVFEIRNERTGDPVESPVRKVLETGRVVGLANHTVLIRRDGTELPIDDSGAPIMDSEGRLFGVVLVFHEIGERRRMERELRQRTEALHEANERKNEFLAMLAHELRNPLAPLHNGVRILRTLDRHAIDKDQLADMMERQTRQLKRLVDDLLDIARITRGTIRLDKEPTPLGAIIEHAVETVRPLIDERGHRLSLELPSADCVVSADLARLSQVFCNLLMNAAKFMDPGGEIRIGVTERETDVLVSVRDRGAGLSEDFLPQIFELFTQGDHSLDRAHGGLGIGLTLVKTLVEMHDGQVSASSGGLGEGSEFTVRLPLYRTSRASRREAPSLQRPLRRKRVLVIDDNVDAAESLGLLLTDQGCDVQMANEGAEALRIARQTTPDAVLLDIGLPGMDGFEVARRLRLIPALEKTLIIAVTGYGSEIDRQRSVRAGFDHHLAKPVDLDELRELLS
ncbi:MAG: response regulator [Gammaproteobacteria bacterium]|nr:response regulator [Gammaproteobacteria bacterium]